LHDDTIRYSDMMLVCDGWMDEDRWTWGP